MRRQNSSLFFAVVVSVTFVLSGRVGGIPAMADDSSAVPESGSTAILKRTQGTARDGSMETQLLSAVDRGDLSEVGRLLDAGADVNTERKVDVKGWSLERQRKLGVHGITPVTLAALKGHTDVMRVLIDAGADMDAMAVRASDGKAVTLVGTALMAAATGGHVDVAKLLIARGANVMASWRNVNALIIAADTGNRDMVTLLVVAGAYKPGSLNGFKALQVAKAKGHTEVAELLQAGFDEYVRSGAAGKSLMQGVLKGLKERALKDPESEFNRRLIKRIEEMESQ